MTQYFSKWNFKMSENLVGSLVPFALKLNSVSCCQKEAAIGVVKIFYTYIILQYLFLYLWMSSANKKSITFSGNEALACSLRTMRTNPYECENKNIRGSNNRSVESCLFSRLNAALMLYF